MSMPGRRGRGRARRRALGCGVRRSGDSPGPDHLAAAIAAEPDAQAMFDVLMSANGFALIHCVESMSA